MYLPLSLLPDSFRALVSFIPKRDTKPDSALTGNNAYGNKPACSSMCYENGSKFCHYHILTSLWDPAFNYSLETKNCLLPTSQRLFLKPGCSTCILMIGMIWTADILCKSKFMEFPKSVEYRQVQARTDVAGILKD